MIRRFLLKSLPTAAILLFTVLLSSCTVDENAALTAAGSPMGEAKKGKKTEVHTGPAPLTWAEKRQARQERKAAQREEEAAARIEDYKVFARVSPEHKVKIVKALKAKGNVVSMTGDGVNDAPSLQSADIGVAMGITGTDVAKNSAEIILTDDNFATIIAAIEQGRNIYNNIKKSVIFLLASNAGEVVVMVIAIGLGWPTPLHATQLLWINLLTDTLPAVALGMDPGDPDIPRTSRARSHARNARACRAVGSWTNRPAIHGKGFLQEVLSAGC